MLAVAIDAQAPLGGQSTKPSSTTATKDDFKFEVFSIKRNKSISMGGDADLLPDGYRATGVSLWDLIMYAYGPESPFYWPNVKIQNFPDWGNSDFYAVDARVADEDIPAWKAQDVNHPDLFRAALRSALRERCRLALHVIPVESPSYSLVVGKHGAKLNASVPGAQVPKQHFVLPFGGVMTTTKQDGITVRTFYGATMQSLASILTIDSRCRPVQDKTGLTGQYDFSLQQLNRDDQTADSDTPLNRWSISDLGLALKPDKSSSFTLVIDHIERPDQN